MEPTDPPQNEVRAEAEWGAPESIARLSQWLEAISLRAALPAPEGGRVMPMGAAGLSALQWGERLQSNFQPFAPTSAGMAQDLMTRYQISASDLQGLSRRLRHAGPRARSAGMPEASPVSDRQTVAAPTTTPSPYADDSERAARTRPRRAVAEARGRDFADAPPPAETGDMPPRPSPAPVSDTVRRIPTAAHERTQTLLGAVSPTPAAAPLTLAASETAPITSAARPGILRDMPWMRWAVMGEMNAGSLLAGMQWDRGTALAQSPFDMALQRARAAQAAPTGTFAPGSAEGANRVFARLGTQAAPLPDTLPPAAPALNAAPKALPLRADAPAAPAAPLVRAAPLPPSRSAEVQGTANPLTRERADDETTKQSASVVAAPPLTGVAAPPLTGVDASPGNTNAPLGNTNTPAPTQESARSGSPSALLEAAPAGSPAYAKAEAEGTSGVSALTRSLWDRFHASLAALTASAGLWAALPTAARAGSAMLPDGLLSTPSGGAFPQTFAAPSPAMTLLRQSGRAAQGTAGNEASPGGSPTVGGASGGGIAPLPGGGDPNFAPKTFPAGTQTGQESAASGGPLAFLSRRGLVPGAVSRSAGLRGLSAAGTALLAIPALQSPLAAAPLAAGLGPNARTLAMPGAGGAGGKAAPYSPDFADPDAPDRSPASPAAPTRSAAASRAAGSAPSTAQQPSQGAQGETPSIVAGANQAMSAGATSAPARTRPLLRAAGAGMSLWTALSARAQAAPSSSALPTSRAMPTGAQAGSSGKTGAVSPPAAPSPVSPLAAKLRAHPLQGQISLFAPAMQVASSEAEQMGTAVAFDWSALLPGVVPLNAGAFTQLRSLLPAGAQAVYPALSPGSGGAGMVNLPLAADLLQSLLTEGYGSAITPLATLAARQAVQSRSTQPANQALPARIVPTKRPMGRQAGLLPQPDAPLPDAAGANRAGALAGAGDGQTRRGGALQFLGMPVQLAPSLSGRGEVRHEVARRGGAGAETQGRVARPAEFNMLRNRLFPSFQNVAAEPDQPAWERVRHDFGLRDTRPTTLLAPDARAQPLLPGAPLPQMLGGTGAKQRLLDLLPPGIASAVAPLLTTLGAGPRASGAISGIGGGRGHLSGQPHPTAHSLSAGSPLTTGGAYSGRGAAGLRGLSGLMPHSGAAAGRSLFPGHAFELPGHAPANLPYRAGGSQGGYGTGGEAGGSRARTSHALSFLSGMAGRNLPAGPMTASGPSPGSFGSPSLSASGGADSAGHWQPLLNRLPPTAPSIGAHPGTGMLASGSQMAGRASLPHSTPAGGTTGSVSAAPVSRDTFRARSPEGARSMVPGGTGNRLAPPFDSRLDMRGGSQTPQGVSGTLTNRLLPGPARFAPPAMPAFRSSIALLEAAKRNETLVLEQETSAPRAQAAPNLRRTLPTPSGSQGHASLLRVQRSEIGKTSTSRETQSAGKMQEAATSSAHDTGGKAYEVYLVANEVWAILKRRLSVEAERRGRF